MTVAEMRRSRGHGYETLVSVAGESENAGRSVTVASSNGPKAWGYQSIGNTIVQWKNSSDWVTCASHRVPAFDTIQAYARRLANRTSAFS
jgi:hypothetical protein